MKQLITLSLIIIVGCRENAKPKTVADVKVDTIVGTDFSPAMNKMLNEAIEAQGIYHIRTKYSLSTSGVDFFVVEFTNDNWRTIEWLKEPYAGDDELWFDDNYFANGMTFQGCQRAIEFAKTFKTYAACRKYNDKIITEANMKRKYEQDHPKPPAPEPPPEKPKPIPVCSPANIY